MNAEPTTPQSPQVASTAGVNRQSLSTGGVQRISRLNKFVNRLKSPDFDSQTRELTVHLVNSLSATTTELLLKWPEGNKNLLHDSLVQALNSFLREEGIPDWFSKLPLTDETSAVLATQPIGDELQHLRLELLMDCYRRELSVSKPARKTSHVGRKGSGLFRIAGIKGIYAKVKIYGKTKTKSLGTDDEEEARVAKAKWEAELLAKHKMVKTAAGTLVSYAPGFFESRQDLVALGKIKQGTVDKQKEVLKHLRDHWPKLDTLPLRDWDDKEIARLQKFLLTEAQDRRYKSSSKGIEPSTKDGARAQQDASTETSARKKKTLSKSRYNCFMALVQSLIESAYSQKGISSDLYLSLTNAIQWARELPRKIKMPTVSEVTKMRVYLYKRQSGRAYGECGVKFDFFMLSGVRRNTACAVQVKHLDFIHKMIKLTKLKGLEGQPTEKDVPLCDELIVILQRWIAFRNLGPDDFLFKTKYNNSSFRKAAKHAGLENWFHHACRKWFSTTAVNQSGDPLGVSDLLCHTGSGAVTFLKHYRQSCAAHLAPLVRSLKFYPGATPDDSIVGATKQAMKAVESFAAIERSKAAILIGHILWIHDQVDEGRTEIFSTLENFQGNPVVPKLFPARIVCSRPTPALLANNLNYLIQRDDVTIPIVAMATGITPKNIKNATLTGRIDATKIPFLCAYFKINANELLTIDLRNSDTTENRLPVNEDKLSAPLSEANAPEAAGTSNGNGSVGTVESELRVPSAEGVADPEKPQNTPEENKKSPDEVLLELGADGLATITQRNINSLLYENGWQVNELAQRSGVAHKQICSYLKRFCHPTDVALTKLANAFGISESEICDPNRNSIVPDKDKTSANLKAIESHYENLGTEFFIAIRTHKRDFQDCASKGQLRYPMAIRIASFAQLSVRELLSEDISARFAAAVHYDAAVVRRNLNSFFFEQGITPVSLANKCGIKVGTLYRFLKGYPFRNENENYAALADGLNVTIGDLTDPDRPETKPTPFVVPNVQHLCGQIGLRPNAYSRGFVDERTVRRICAGHAIPNYDHTKGLSDLFGVSPRELLTQDLRTTVIEEYKDISGRRRWRPVSNSEAV